jgi:osmotically-inducible protein OsmY
MMKYPQGLPVTLVTLLAACATVACVTSVPRSEAERAVEAGIAAQVEAALTAEQNIYARHIVVAVDRGVVRLGGLVWSEQELRLARRDAASVPGVTAVESDIELVRGGISGRR